MDGSSGLPLLPLSAAFGVGHRRRPTTVSRFGNRLALWTLSGVIVAAMALQLRGVGHRCSDDEYAVAEMRGADGCRWYAVPFRVIPARGQSTEDVIKSGSKEPWHVFQQDASGS